MRVHKTVHAGKRGKYQEGSRLFEQLINLGNVGPLWKPMQFPLLEYVNHASLMEQNLSTVSMPTP